LSDPAAFSVYGTPPEALVEVPPGAVQVSPLIPGAADLEALDPASFTGAVVAAPPGTVERRYVLVRVLQALAPGAPLTALAPKEKGGARLRKELEALGCVVAESGRQHQRICHTRRPDALAMIEEALAAGALRHCEFLGLWTQPGVFSWDRPDPGTCQLLAALPTLAGRGADLGCGLGVLARAVLAARGVTHIDLIDLDRRAIAAGLEDRELGQAFIRRAHQLLRPGGSVWLVANRHLPYEAVLSGLFAKVTARGEGQGQGQGQGQGFFKVYEARK
jgi:16S rRNA (guanine1207-N2)-methyltransferase